MLNVQILSLIQLIFALYFKSSQNSFLQLFVTLFSTKRDNLLKNKFRIVFSVLGVALGRRQCQRLLPATSNNNIPIKSGTLMIRTCQGYLELLDYFRTSRLF